MKIIFPLSDAIRKIRGRIFRIKVRITNRVFQRSFMTHKSESSIPLIGFLLHSRSYFLTGKIFGAYFLRSVPISAPVLSVNKPLFLPQKINHRIQLIYRLMTHHGIICGYPNFRTPIIKKELITIPVSYPAARHQYQFKGI